MALITVSGHLFDPSGAATAGSVTFQLANYGASIPRVIGTNSVVATNISFVANSSGFWTGSIQGNDTIDPGATQSPPTTFYEVSFKDVSGNTIATLPFQFTGAGPANLDTQGPMNAVPQPFVPPNNAALLGSSQTFTGNNTFNGTTTINTLIAGSTTISTLSGTIAGNPSFSGNVFFTGGPANLYVASAGNGGSDSNDCLSATVSGGHGPCLTINHAIITAVSYVQPTCPTINVGAGTFLDTFVAGPLKCGSGIDASGFDSGLAIIGAGSTTILDATTRCGGLTTAGSGAAVFIKNMTVQWTATGICGNNGAALFAANNSWIFTGSGITFGTAPQGIHAEANATVEVFNNYTINQGASAAAFFVATTNGAIIVDGLTANCSSGTTNYTTAFGWSDFGGVIQIGGAPTFTACGSITGKRFAIDGGFISFQGGSTPWTLFPGNADGYIRGFGMFDPIPTSSLGTCVNGALQANATDAAMTVTFSGTNSAGCNINFSRTMQAIPSCTISNSAGNATSLTVTTSRVTIQRSNFGAGEIVTITCLPQPYL